MFTGNILISIKQIIISRYNIAIYLNIFIFNNICLSLFSLNFYKDPYEETLVKSKALSDQNLDFFPIHQIFVTTLD